MNWGLEDVTAALAILAGTASLVTGVMRIFRYRSRQMFFAVVIMVIAALIWAHLAVGVF